jgi:hypothetical protein
MIYPWKNKSIEHCSREELLEAITFVCDKHLSLAEICEANKEAAAVVSQNEVRVLNQGERRKESGRLWTKMYYLLGGKERREDKQ